jgi:hypothetical protein
VNKTSSLSVYNAENANFTAYQKLTPADNINSPTAFEVVNLNTLFMNVRKLLSIPVFIIMTGAAFAQAPKYSNEFLSIGVGGRAMGMAGSVSGSISDATAAVWNPAGLALIESNLQIAAMHSELFAGISKFDYATIATHIDTNKTLAFSVIRFGTDEIPNTLELIDAAGVIDYSKIKSFAIADYSFMFSYSMKTKIEGLSLGGNAKIIHRKTGEFGKAWGFGFDAGAQYRKNHWQFGVMGKDITSTFNAWSYNTETFEEAFIKTNNEIPKNSTEITLPKLILGAGYKWDLSKKLSALAELDLDITFDGRRNVLLSSDPVSADPHFGFELGYSDFIFLRGGVQNIQDVKNFDGTKSKIVQPNMGLGIKIGKLTIDYALTNIGSTETLYSNVFSLKLDISRQN